MAKRRRAVEIQNILKMSLWWYRYTAWCCAKGYRPRD